MEATTFCVTHDAVVDTARERCRVRAFGEVRVAVLSEVRGAMAPLAMEVEQRLDVRFFGTSWRLVEQTGGDLLLVTFAGYDGLGALVGPEWQPAPAAMDWVRDALQQRP